MTRRLFSTFVLLLTACSAGGNAVAEPVVLADGGTARLPVVVKPTASATTRAAAEELVAVLGRISGAVFLLRDSAEPPASGIFVGVKDEFPLPEFHLGLPQSLRFHEPLGRPPPYLAPAGGGGIRGARMGFSPPVSPPPFATRPTAGGG